MLGFGSTVADLAYILVAYAGADPLSRQAWARALLFGAGSLVLIGMGARAMRGAVAPAGHPAHGAAPATVPPAVGGSGWYPWRPGSAWSASGPTSP